MGLGSSKSHRGHSDIGDGDSGGLRTREEVRAHARNQVTSHDRSVLQLKRQRDSLSQYTRMLEARSEAEMRVVKELLGEARRQEEERGRHESLRSRALVVLRKVRAQEALVQRTGGMLLNVERLIDSLEWSRVEVEVANALRTGKDELERLNKLLNISNVERLMDEVSEAVDEQEYIQAMLSEALPSDLEISESSLSAELDDMETRILEERLGPVDGGERERERERESEREREGVEVEEEKEEEARVPVLA